jgi:hypothetical protein
MEPVILFVRDDIAIPNIGYKYQRYMPLLLNHILFYMDKQPDWFGAVSFRVALT